MLAASPFPFLSRSPAQSSTRFPLCFEELPQNSAMYTIVPTGLSSKPLPLVVVVRAPNCDDDSGLLVGNQAAQAGWCTMWARFRKWRYAVAFPLAIVAGILIRRDPDGSAFSNAGIIVAVALGLTYVIEEVVWGLRRKGQPCANCGQSMRLRSFSVRTTCPRCGAPL